ncbi:hypothetical protein DH86_00003283 [Scytalidium sp. 3C]|nr:hypothetical protein DH86_00003283 [Scytalidium sp. 3C]
MEALKGNSFFAEDHRDDFLQLSNNFQFISFYEANKLKGLHQVVRREDAVLNLPDMKEDKIPLDADHSQMCRFSEPNGRDFRAVWPPIKIMAENAVKQSKETST